MYDAVTLDQLRAFVTVVEAGSFSAAARKLRRVQSAVSTSMANLEAHLGLRLWDRSTRVARLTAEGQVVLAAARRVLAEVDGLHQLTAGLTAGLEASVSLCIDALFPLPALLSLCTAFTAEFPTVDLRIDVQVLSAVSARVQGGDATLGIASPAGILPGLERQNLAPIRLFPVVSPTHPLARARGPLRTEKLAHAIQVVLSERGETGTPDQGVLSPRTWRVADLHTKHRMLRAGLGWGNLPEHLVRDDLRAGRLVPIRLEAWGKEELVLTLAAVYRRGVVFGPAHRWILARLRTFTADELARGQEDDTSPPADPPPEPRRGRRRAR